MATRLVCFSPFLHANSPLSIDSAHQIWSVRLNLRFLIQTIEIYSFRIKDQHYIISSARDDDVGGVDIVAKSERHQELRRSALCTSCNLQEVSAHKQQQVQLNLQLYPPDATDITANTKLKINNNNYFIDITMH